MFGFLNIFKSNKPRIKTSKSVVMEKWKEVEMLVAMKNPSSLKQAVIVSDKLLEKVIKDATGAPTLGAGLKVSDKLFSSWAMYQVAWEAHKVRNAMVHDTNYDAPHYVTKEAVDKFERVFKDLGLL